MSTAGPFPRLPFVWAAVGLLAWLGPAPLEAQASFRGVVRDTAGGPLAGAEVTFDSRSAVTGQDGTFRFDSLKAGSSVLVIRLVGYRPHRGTVVIPASGESEADYFLIDAPASLPEIVVAANRPGIYGTVGDTAFRAAMGAEVQVLGYRGGTALTDSAGRFAFPAADHGVYLVRVTLPGYTERRMIVEVGKGDGLELAVLMTPGALNRASRSEDAALQALDQRLAWNRRESMLTAPELRRYGTRSLCDVPRIRSIVGETATVLLNGETVLRNYPICGWNADELALIEFGAEVCRDVTGTTADATSTYCSGTTTSVPGSRRSLTGAGTVGRGGGYLILWERR